MSKGKRNPNNAETSQGGQATGSEDETKTGAQEGAASVVVGAEGGEGGSTAPGGDGSAENSAEEAERIEAERQRLADEEKAKGAAKLVKMSRGRADGGEPETADVHPDEVTNWSNFGWSVSEQAK